jgi:signal transduction histidine kinase
MASVFRVTLAPRASATKRFAMDDGAQGTSDGSHRRTAVSAASCAGVSPVAAAGDRKRSPIVAIVAAMASTPAPAPRIFPRLLGWRRLRVVGGACLLLSLLILVNWQASYLLLLVRLLLVGLIALLVFGLFERWPNKLPAWLPRWVLQVLGVAVLIPVATAVVYGLTSYGDPQPWYHSKARMGGFGMIAGLGLLFAPWIAMTALYRQISGEAQRQALAFELERSEFARNALDARLRLLQAQVEPHFLFNTLANVRELVDSGSPQASTVLGHLIAYLRAAVPRLHETTSTLGQEVELVSAYLEVMRMRMPDRMQFSLHADEAALPLACPPMTLLTLVENAVRHGIDPSEQGGRIDVRVRVRDGRCRVEVSDTGAGLQASDQGLGTGLSTLRERLQLAFGGDASLSLVALSPHGACAEAEFPARRNAP